MVSRSEAGPDEEVVERLAELTRLVAGQLGGLTVPAWLFPLPVSASEVGERKKLNPFGPSSGVVV